MAARRTSTPKVVRFLATVSDRQVKVIASDGTVDRMGDILVPSGCDLTNYRRNPVVLAQHDSSQPIGRCSYIAVVGNQVLATIDFPPIGQSETGDLYCRLMKGGIIAAVSVGFIPLQQEPMASGGWKFTSWELLELSCVSVPANPNALVSERGFTGSSRADHLTRIAQLRRFLAGATEPAAFPVEDYVTVSRKHDRARAEDARIRSRILDQRTSADAAMRAGYGNIPGESQW
jgi:HK97 family phage prohead protease